MLVDVQQGMFDLPSPLYRGEEVVQRLAGLLTVACVSRCSRRHTLIRLSHAPRIPKA
jgi:hypothetical protein